MSHFPLPPFDQLRVDDVLINEATNTKFKILEKFAPFYSNKKMLSLLNMSDNTTLPVDYFTEAKEQLKLFNPNPEVVINTADNSHQKPAPFRGQLGTPVEGENIQIGVDDSDDDDSDDDDYDYDEKVEHDLIAQDSTLEDNNLQNDLSQSSVSDVNDTQNIVLETSNKQLDLGTINDTSSEDEITASEYSINYRYFSICYVHSMGFENMNLRTNGNYIQKSAIIREAKNSSNHDNVVIISITELSKQDMADYNS